MKKDKKILKPCNIVSGTLPTEALFGFTPSDAEASNLFDYKNIGSGAERRSELIEKNYYNH